MSTPEFYRSPDPVIDSCQRLLKRYRGTSKRSVWVSSALFTFCPKCIVRVPGDLQESNEFYYKENCCSALNPSDHELLGFQLEHPYKITEIKIFSIVIF